MTVHTHTLRHQKNKLYLSKHVPFEGQTATDILISTKLEKVLQIWHKAHVYLPGSSLHSLSSFPVILLIYADTSVFGTIDAEIVLSCRMQ